MDEKRRSCLSVETVRMARLLMIADLTDNVFLTMPEVLEPLRPDADALTWTILDLGNVIAREDSGLNVLELERKVDASAVGIDVTFAELADLASKTRQVIDALFVARDKNTPALSRRDEDRAILARSAMVLAAVDSTFWLLSAPEQVSERVETRFRDVREQDPAATSLSAWGRR
jgi:hypothetical protein